MATEMETVVVIPEEENNVVPNEALNKASELSDELIQEEQTLTHMSNSLAIQFSTEKQAKPRQMVLRKNTLFSSHNDLTRGRRCFFGVILYAIVPSAEELPPRARNVLLLLLLSIERFQVEMLSGRLDNDKKLGAIESQLVLSMMEALTKFYIEMAYMTMIVLLYLMILLLVRPQPLILQIFIMLIWISAPIFYVPEMMDKASKVGVSVTWGSFKLSFPQFTASGAVILSLMFVPLLLTLLYLIGGRNRGERNEG